MSPVIKVRRCKSNLHAQPCWHGYCAACGKGLSFYDWSEEDCHDISLKALSQHDCPKPKQEQLALGASRG